MVAIHACDKCHMLKALGCLLLHHSCGDPPWFHVAPTHGVIWHHAKCHTTPHTSKNVKFRLSRNPTKFDIVVKFRETIPTVTSVSSSEIYQFSRFSQSSKITILPFFEKNCIYLFIYIFFSQGFTTCPTEIS